MAASSHSQVFRDGSARRPGLRRLRRRQRPRARDGAGAGPPRRHRRRLRAPRGAAGGDRRAGRGAGRQLRAREARHPRGGGGRPLLRRAAGAPRPPRRARQQRRRPVPQPGRGDHPEGLPHRDRAQRPGHLADDPRRRDQGLHPAGRRQGAQRHPLPPQRDAGDGPLRRRPRRGREHDADAGDRVGALRDQDLRARRRPVRDRDAADQVSAGGRRQPRALDPDRPRRPLRGDGLAGRLPRLAGRRLLLRHDDHDRRRPRQLGRPLAARRRSPTEPAPPSPRSAARRTETELHQISTRRPGEFDAVRRGYRRGSRTTSGISRPLLRPA